MARVGIWGGTFDPPHLGHLIAASDACRALALDGIVWVPAGEQPLKRGRVRTPAALRLAMVRAAVAGDARFSVDPLEVERPGPSYMADTLAALAARAPGDARVLLLGADAWREFPRWRRPEAVARLAALAVLSREGEDVAAGGPFDARPVRVTRVDVSSTEVRRRVAAGECIRYLVPEAVRALIEAHGLYRGSSI